VVRRAIAADFSPLQVTAAMKSRLDDPTEALAKRRRLAAAPDSASISWDRDMDGLFLRRSRLRVRALLAHRFLQRGRGHELPIAIWFPRVRDMGLVD
jgi:hypothetical protein